MPNGCWDACSAEPVTKFELLDHLSKKFGLEWKTKEVDPVRMSKPDKVSVWSNGSGIKRSPYTKSLSLVEREMTYLVTSSQIAVE